MNATTATRQPRLRIRLKYTVDNSQPFTPEPLQQQKTNYGFEFNYTTFKKCKFKSNTSHETSAQASFLPKAGNTLCNVHV